MTGTQIITEGIALLRALGGKVINFNSNRRVRFSGFVDVLWFYHDTTWLIEVKGDGDKFSDDQTKFAEDISGHRGLHVRYRVVNSVAGFEQIAREGAGIDVPSEKILIACKAMIDNETECGAQATYNLPGIGPVCNLHATFAIAAGLKSILSPLEIE